ncbi:MAG: hypothetical protein BZY81_04350 [SAR202 cluster bacterium Io17-Chloro-G4]|nr:MAG: hypothetical protein BZY81_04350 [SAR202 cluster bacterium Io17-Chloro-G4]
MLVLVTGATGFLGRRVVPALLARHHQVRCLVHTPGRERVFPPRTVDIQYGNVLNPDALTVAFNGVDAAVHLVGTIRRGNRNTYDQINRQGVANVVAAAKAARVKHLVFVSAIGATGNPGYPYLFSKWQGEQEVANSGLSYTIIQSSIIFGPGDEFLNTIAAMVKTLPVVTVAGSGKNRIQPIDVEDVSWCIATAVDLEVLKGKTIELGGPEQLSINEVFGIVARTMGKRRLRLHLPVWLMFIMTWFSQVLPRPPITMDQLRLLPMRNVAEPQSVEDNFGFTPKTVEGNIDYVKLLSTREAFRILSGDMPSRIRDH